jgi:hypothetical protein
MNSGNSGSLQSSSGVGEDELDSRCGGSVDSSPLSALLRLSASPSLSSSGFGATFYGLQELEASTPLPPLPQVVHQHHWSAALPASDRAASLGIVLVVPWFAGLGRHGNGGTHSARATDAAEGVEEADAGVATRTNDGAGH